jgi:hypothetical protein
MWWLRRLTYVHSVWCIGRSIKSELNTMHGINERNVGKYCTVRHSTDGNKIRRVRIACWIPNATKHTLRMCYCFHTTTVVARSRINFTLHVHCLLLITNQIANRIRMELQFHPDPACKLSTTLYDIDHCCVYSEDTWWWTEELSETCRVSFQKNKFEKLVHLVGFITRIHHDARSHERQISTLQVLMNFTCKSFAIVAYNSYILLRLLIDEYEHKVKRQSAGKHQFFFPEKSLPRGHTVHHKSHTVSAVGSLRLTTGDMTS